MANLIDTINTQVTDTAKKVYGNSNIDKTKAVLSTPTSEGMSTNTILTPTITPKVDIVKSAQSTVAKGTPITTDSLKSIDKIILPDKKITDTETSITLPEVTTPLQAEQARLKAEKTTQEGGIQTLLKNIGIEQGKEATFATELGADKAQQEYDRFASELEAEQLANRRRIESLQKNNPQGLFGGGLEQEINRINNESLSKQADIAILGNAAKGRFDTALSIAKRKVESALRPMQAELDAKKFVYESNKDLFSKAELSKLDSLIKIDDRKIKAEEDRLTESNKLILNAIQSKAPQSIIDEANKLQREGKSVTDIVSTLGSYSVDPEKALDLKIKQQSLIKSINENNKTGTTINPKILNTTQFKNAQAAQNLKLTLQKAIDAVKLYGNKEKLSGTGKGILDSIKVQLRSEISTALEQGVVVPGEAAAFDSIAGQINDSYFIRNSKTLASLNSLKNSMDGRIALQKSALTNTYNVKPDQVDLLLNVTDISDQEFADMDAQIQ